MRRWKLALAAGVALAPSTAQSQIQLHGGPNVPGRVFYSCYRYFGSSKEHGGTLKATKTFAEDGTLLGMNVEWDGSFESDPRRQPGFDIVHQYGTQRGGYVTLNWPLESYGKPVLFDWANPGLTINLFGTFTGDSAQARKKEPWRQILIDRSDRLRTIDQNGQRYVLPLMGVVLSTPLDSTATNGLRVPLTDLLAWGSGVDAITVYETRVARRKFDPNVSPNGPGPNRVVLQYTMSPATFVRIGAAVRKEVEAWEAEIADFKTKCTRQVEDDESKEIVV